jgi:hypothetical protein
MPYDAKGKFRVGSPEPGEKHISRRHASSAPGAVRYNEDIAQRSGGHLGTVCPNTRHAPLNWRCFLLMRPQQLCQRA